jgi:hypothetical protein
MHDKQNNVEARLEANIETLNSKIPILKIIAYGNDCTLEDSKSVSSLQELQNQTTNSYYSSGKDFYVKLVPENLSSQITPNSGYSATGYQTSKRFLIRCSNKPIEKRVIGNIESVMRNPSTTVVNGWACNFTHFSQIQVKLYAALRSQNQTIPLTNPSPVLLGTTTSNLSPDPRVTMLCGNMSSIGKKFTFTINNQQLQHLNNHYFYVEGISNSGGQNVFIDQSGFFPVKNIVKPPYQDPY